MAPILFAFCAAVILYDLKQRRVPNWLSLVGVLSGLAVNSLRGIEYLRSSLMGIALGLLLLFPFFALRMVGGGDVKALAAIGAITGPRVLWISFLVGAAAGGLVAVPTLISLYRRKRSCERNLTSDGQGKSHDRSADASGDIHGPKTTRKGSLGESSKWPRIARSRRPGNASSEKVGSRERKNRSSPSRSQAGPIKPRVPGIPYAAVMASCAALVHLSQTLLMAFR